MRWQHKLDDSLLACYDNQDNGVSEAGVDCGGDCNPCKQCAPAPAADLHSHPERRAGHCVQLAPRDCLTCLPACRRFFVIEFNATKDAAHFNIPDSDENTFAVDVSKGIATARQPSSLVLYFPSVVLPLRARPHLPDYKGRNQARRHSASANHALCAVHKVRVSRARARFVVPCRPSGA